MLLVVLFQKWTCAEVCYSLSKARSRSQGAAAALVRQNGINIGLSIAVLYDIRMYKTQLTHLVIDTIILYIHKTLYILYDTDAMLVDRPLPSRYGLFDASCLF